MTTHTIVLAQPTKNLQSRTFYDYDTLNLALEGIVRLYESHLKEVNPSIVSITYTLADLIRYVDYLPDLSLLALNVSSRQYQPHDKQWIKGKLTGLFQQSMRR